jgi:hypothetical protein
MTSKKEHTNKYIRVKERVQKIKGFYGHLLVYLIINTSITVYKVVKCILGIEEFWDFGIFAVWIFWGLALAIHAIKVFDKNLLFGNEWEKRQIQKYMDDERRDTEKYIQIGNGYGNE